MMNVKKTDLVGVLLIDLIVLAIIVVFFLKPIINDYMLGLGSMPTSFKTITHFQHPWVRCGGCIFRYHLTLKPSWCAAGGGQFLMWLLIYEGEVQLTGNGQAASSVPQMAYRCSFQQALRTGS